MTLGDLSGTLVYFDSNILIHAMEAREPAPILSNLFEALDSGVLRAVTSELTLAEVLSKPLLQGETNLAAKYEFLIHPDGPVTSVNVTREVLLKSARLRAESSLHLADAIHMATALSTGCNYFMSEDERLGRALGDNPHWLRLSDLAS